MTLLEINLTDVLSETDPDDRVVVWAPAFREGPAGGLVGPRRKSIPLVDGVGSDEVVPGPLMVQVQCKAMSDTLPREVVVPEEGPVTLTGLLDSADAFTYAPPVVGQVTLAARRAEDAAVRAEGVADAFGSLEGVVDQVQAAADAALSASGSAASASASASLAGTHAEATGDDRRQTGEDRLATGEDVDDTAALTAAAIAAAWSFDGFTPAQVADAALRAEDAAVRAEASGGGIIVVSSEEEAAALPIGTVYVIAAEVAPGEPTPVTIVGTVGENITTDTFTPTIPNATTGDTIIIAANTKAVAGSTLTAPAGFTTLIDGYYIGTQRSWVLAGPWSGDLTITADQPLEFGYAAVAVRGATSVTAGTVKNRTEEPTESVTVTAPAVEHGTNDLAIGIAFERTSATETPEQVTVNAGWTIEHYTAQGANFQTTLIGTGGTGDMVATYPNPQATNGTGVQVVAHA